MNFFINPTGLVNFSKRCNLLNKDQHQDNLFIKTIVCDNYEAYFMIEVNNISHELFFFFSVA